MGANQTNDGLLAFLALLSSGAEVLAWVGFRGHGAHRDHRTGAVAVDTDGLLRLKIRARRTSLHEASIATGVESWLGLGVKSALMALPTPAPSTAQSTARNIDAWRMFEAPSRIVGVAIEASPDGPVALPIIGGPGEHVCGPIQPLASDLSIAPWLDWIHENWQDVALFERLIAAVRRELSL